MSRRSETLNAAAWALAGAAILAASWRMDRLESRGINPLTIPALLPGVVGALMIVLALLLALQAAGAKAEPTATHGVSAGGAGDAGALRPTLAALALCVLFAGVTLGSGLPFIVEGAVFIALFNIVFGWPVWRAEGRIARGVGQALLVAVAASTAISWLFESVFLVRLP